MAVRKQCIPKTGDASQTFCQSYLPEGETYHQTFAWIPPDTQELVPQTSENTVRIKKQLSPLV